MSLTSLSVDPPLAIPASVGHGLTRRIRQTAGGNALGLSGQAL